MSTCSNCGFANPEGARFCSNCGTALEPSRPIEGERRFASVLFADVARSTAIAEQLDAEDWALIMNGAFGFMNAAVSRYGGTVSRLMGDAVLALFGAPVAHEDDAERAVRAGLEIQEAGMAYAQAVKQRYGVDFDLRVGINTGTAVLALVGDAVKSEYTALGDAANIAARLQSAAEPGTVLISADTYRLVHALFDVKPRGHIEMKGKLAPVDSYEVTGVKAAPGSTRGLAGLASPLVGRDSERALLAGKLADLDKGIGAVVAVIGEAGLGKSRLIAELRQLRDALPDPRPPWLETRALSYGMAIPYYPWRALGRQMVGATDMDAAPAVRQKLEAFVRRLKLRPLDLPLYETLLAVDSEQSRLALAGKSGDAVVGGVAEAVVNAIRSAMHEGGSTIPHVVIMDDLHWSDSATLELIAQVATLAAFEPLLLVCVLRPDRNAPSWQLVDRLQASLGSSFSRIDLEPLDPARSAELLGNLLHIEDLPNSIRAQILERSEGNPFYLEEVLRTLIDGGQVVREGEHWRATRDILDARIPDTLAGVLSARIDRLPEATKRVAQTAAVIGRVFQHRVLETVCREAPPAERIEHVEPHLATLSYEQLVRERARDPEREYIFKHALTCAAAYDLLLRSRRRELHARAGLALETLYAERRDEFAAMLAHHFTEAEDPVRALDYSRRAAENARKLFAAREELEHRERILTILEHKADAVASEIIDATLDWALIRHRLANYEGVLDRLEKAVSMARETGDKERLALALSWTANTHMVMGFPSKSVPYLLESSDLATELGNEQVLLLPLFFATWSIADRDPRDGADKLREVIDIARKYNVLDVLGHAMAIRAITLARLGNFDEARAQLGEAMDQIPRINSPVREADIRISAGVALYEMGDIEAGLEQARLGAELAFKVNGMECACAGYYVVGKGELERHRLDEAEAELNRSLKLADIAGFEGYVNMIRGNLAMTQFEKGASAAVEKLRSSYDNARTLNDEYAAASLGQQLAVALLKLNRTDEAEKVLGFVTGVFRDKSMRPSLANALELASRLYERTGREEDARRARDEAEELRASVLLSPPPEAEEAGRAADRP
ncbi:MAG TPA: adenylate/guanylate cyclase domain-containing protein [Devosia sp.]